MSQLLKSWADSLKIFYPKNLKLFLLVTLNSVWLGFKVLFKSLWWFLLLDIAMMALLVYGNHLFTLNQIYVNYILMAIQAFWVFFIYLAVRPSRERKTPVYFLSYFKYLLYFSPFLFVVGFLTTKTSAFFDYQVGSILGAFISLTGAFTMLFFLDSDGSIKSLMHSIVRGFKMLCYNFPFVFVLASLVIYGIRPLFDFIIRTMNIFFTSVCIDYSSIICIMLGIGSFLLIKGLRLVMLILLVSIYTNFYVKKVHDQFKLYF